MEEGVPLEDTGNGRGEEAREDEDEEEGGGIALVADVEVDVDEEEEEKEAAEVGSKTGCSLDRGMADEVGTAFSPFGIEGVSLLEGGN